MASARSSRRYDYRPGSESYARLSKARLKRKAALAEVNAVRAKAPDTRRRAKKRASAARRALRAIETREDFRSKLNERDRAVFNHLSISQQQQMIELQREYPDSVPRDLPDPFSGPKREVSWRLFYATRAGIRLKRSA